MSWFRIFRMCWMTTIRIRRKIRPRNRNRYAGFLPISSRNPTIDSQMLAMFLRDRHVVVRAAEILCHPQPRREDESGKFSIVEEMVEPLDLAASRPPRHPHVAWVRTRGSRLPCLLLGFLSAGPRGHEDRPSRTEGSIYFPHRGEPLPLGGKVMDRRDRHRGGEGRVAERKPAQVASDERRLR